MTDRGALKGRLAEVYVPALVEGTLEALSRRLGNRAVVDDPIHGRASTLSSIDPLLAKISRRLSDGGATYRHIGTVTGTDCDVAEGVLALTIDGSRREVPIAVVGERRRLREIELRVYHAPLDAGRPVRLPSSRATTEAASSSLRAALPQIVAHFLDALRRGAVERILAAFEEGSRWVDPHGKPHAKRDGGMATFLDRLGGRLEIVPTSTADDGRTCCLEAVVTRRAKPDAEPVAIALAFERGESGLLRELRLYY